MSEWQPIETVNMEIDAPPVDLWIVNRTGAGWRVADCTRGDFGRYKGWATGRDRHCVAIDPDKALEGDLVATHWMMPPEPPK